MRPGFGSLGVYENYISLELEQCIAGYLLQYHRLIIVILATYDDCNSIWRNNIGPNRHIHAIRRKITSPEIFLTNYLWFGHFPLRL